MKLKRKRIWIAVALLSVVFIIISPKAYFLIRYKYIEEYSHKFHLPNHTVKVYIDSWFNGFAPGGGSDAPCIVKLIDNNTGKCLYTTRLGMIQLINDVIVRTNSISFIGIETEWEF